MNVELYGGPTVGPASWKIKRQIPKVMVKTIEAHQQAAEKIADELYAKAEGLKGPAYEAAIDRAGKAQAKVAVARMRLSGPEGLKMLKEELAATDDAGVAIPAAINAALWITQFAFETHRSAEAWLDERPPDGQLQLKVVTTPSGHVGLNDAAKAANRELFARTNRYVAEVIHRDPNGRETRLLRQDFAVSQAPEFATESPTLTVDLNQLKGDLVVRGWAAGSAGVGGYRAGRETIIHL